MRLHKPVHPHHQPHLAHSFAKTEHSYAGSGAGGGHAHASSGDQHAASGAGFHQGGIPADGYDDGGTVNPNSFLGWPNETPGFEDGGQVDPQEFLNSTPDTGTDLQTLADHANQVYTDYHKQLEQAWHAGQGGGDTGQGGNDNDADDQGYAAGGEVNPADEGDPRWENVPHESVDNVAPFNSFWQSDAQLAKHADLPEIPVVDGKPATATGQKLKEESEQGFAGGGGVPMPSGPAGAGVTPQSPAGNPGRPNYIDPNANAAAQKNYAQNVSARQFTSPSVGTAYEQPPPIGGQRGQEWYGKKGGAGLPMTPGGR